MSSLREKLKALEAVQSIDLETNGVQAEADAVPRRRAELEASVAEARRAYDLEKVRLDDNERERRGIEGLLSMEREKVKKWEGRLGEIKTPREYAALSREIDISKKANETQSEQLKALAAAADGLRKSLDEKAGLLADRELGAKAAIEELERRTVELRQKLDQLAARRAEAATIVEPSLLSRYESLKKRRAGVALAPVVGSTCRGCNRNIPPQLSIVLQRADSIESCPNCHRIIYSAAAVNPPADGPA